MVKKKPVRIPTVAALFFLLIMLFAGIYSWDHFSLPESKAQSFDYNPQDVRVSNVNNTSFIVSYTTLKEARGYIKWGNQSFFDISDTDSLPKPYKVHYIKVDKIGEKNEPYNIISEGKNFAQTAVYFAPKIEEPPQVLPLNGNIKNASGTNVKRAVFYLELPGSAPASFFLTNGQSWVFPLSYVRTTDLKTYFCQNQKCADTIKAKLEVVSEDGNSFISSFLKNLQPLKEPIIIGQNYDLTLPTPTQVFIPTPTLSPKSKVKGAKTQAPANKVVEILNPVENATLPFNKPFIRGTGHKGSDVSITLDSNFRQIAQVKVGEDGTWHYTPETALAPGKQLLTISTKDASGRKLTLKREFFVSKSGERVLAYSTSSATTTPSYPTYPTTPIYPTASPTPFISGSSLPSYFMAISGFVLLFIGLAFI